MSRKRKPVSPRSLNPALVIDSVIGAFDRARVTREAYQGKEEDLKVDIVRLAEKYGTPDGDSFRLHGRHRTCVVSRVHPITIEPVHRDDLPGKWRRQLTCMALSYSATKYLRDLVHRRVPRTGLPKSVRTFLRRVAGEVSYSVRLERKK